MPDADQHRKLATWVNKNSKRLNDSAARARSQEDFRAVLADATAYLDQLRSERDSNATALADVLRHLEQGPANSQEEVSWVKTETDLRRDAQMRQQFVSEFDRHITACEALIVWVQGQLTPAPIAAAASPAAAGAKRTLIGGSKLKWVLAAAVGIIGILVAARLLLPLLAARGSASAGQTSATATASPQPAQALLPAAAAITPTREQVVASEPDASPTSVAAVVEPGQAAGQAVEGTVVVEPSQTAGQAANPSPTSSFTPTPRPAPTETSSPAPTSTRSASATPEPSATPTAAPTATPASTATATATRGQTPTRPAASPTARAATATPVPPRPSPTTVILSVPVLLEPAPNVSSSGPVKFAWQGTGPLPPDASYEVVWWNTGEDPASARGMAATTRETSLIANLDDLYAAGRYPSNEFYWTVLIVQTEPYVRLTQPGQSGPQRLTYAGPSQGGGGGEPPPPNRP